VSGERRAPAPNDPPARPPGYRHAIFDFDGTLADSFPRFVHIVNRAAEEFRFRRIEADEVEPLRGYGARRIVRHLAVPTWKLPLIARRMRRMMSEELDGVRLFPGVGDALRRLSERGVSLAIVTSNSLENVRRVLGAENGALIGRYACDVPVFGKRRVLRRVIRESGVPVARTIYIGDELRDLEAAHAEGVAFGAVAWGYTRLDALVEHGPAEVFRDLDELVAAVAPAS
jgi:phosphoglycolate phosphatase